MEIKIIIAAFTDGDGNSQVGFRSDPPYPELVRLWKENAFADEKQRACILYALEAMGAVHKAGQEADKRDKIMKAKPRLKPVPSVAVKPPSS